MKYRINKEGSVHIFVAVIAAVIAVYAAWAAVGILWISLLISLVFVLLAGWVIYFFRVPDIIIRSGNSELLSAADGKVVVIEEVENDAFPDGKALQVSVFMSPFDTHLNRFPVAGQVTGVEYHKGKFLPAYHPKSSELNERNTVKMVSDEGKVIWIRQIAGIMARRIVNYAEEGKPVYAGEALGFIKFGSRVDHFFPTDCTVRVKLNDRVNAGLTVLADA